MYSVAGNHDLKYHNRSEMDKSVYGVLAHTGTIKDIHPKHPLLIGNLMVHGFPHGVDAVPLGVKGDNYFHLAVVHSYIWKRGCQHYQVTIDTSYSAWQPKIRGYHAAVFGDNHKSFLVRHPAFPTILNCGAAIRRTSDERDYQPRVGLVQSDGSIVCVHLDCDADVFQPDSTDMVVDCVGHEVHDFIEELKGDVSNAENIDTIIRRRLEEIRAEPDVTKLVLQSLESHDHAR